MGFELRLYFGLSVPNERAETCTVRRLNPVLFENRIHHLSSGRERRRIIQFANTSLRAGP